MRAISEVRARRGAWALLLGVALLVALASTVSSDQPIDASGRPGSVVQAALADDVPPGVLPEVAVLAVVWLAFALAGLGSVALEHRRAEQRRGRAPPSSPLPA